MGTITAKSIIDKAAIQLIDLTSVRWTRAELLGWINEGQRQIVQLDPAANSVTASVALTSGTRQTIPATGWKLLDVRRNMGATGVTPGRAIRATTRQLLDNWNPDWHAATPTAVVEGWIPDPVDSAVFFVTPPNNGTQQIEITYSKTPTVITNENTAIELDDVLEPALLNYVLARACGKDAEYAPGVALSGAYSQAFFAALKPAGAG